MESGPTFIVERLGHEGGQLVLLTRQLLNGALEAESTVGGIESFGVPQIDLELSAGELVVRGDNLQPVRGEVAKGAAAHSPGRPSSRRRTLPVASP